MANYIPPVAQWTSDVSIKVLLLYGTIEILSDEADRMKAMKIFLQKFFSHVSPGSYEDFTTQDAKPIHVAKIKIESWFGKEHLVPELALDSFYPGIDPVII